MSRRILLTGATGFVGKQVLKVLQANKANITLVARPDWKKKLTNLTGITNTIETKNLFAESAPWWTNACKNVDTVIHVAWYAEPGEYLCSDKNITCLQGSLQLAKGAINANVRRFIGIGTCFEYDLKYGMLSTNTPLKPITPYASSKAALFLALSGWLSQHNMEFAWCRLFYLYGEDEDERRFAPFVRSRIENNLPAELTSGNQIRDYLNVIDAGQMIANVAFDSSQGAINICSGIPITIRQFAEKIADEYGKRQLLKFGTRPDNLVDPACVVGIK